MSKPELVYLLPVPEKLHPHNQQLIRAANRIQISYGLPLGIEPLTVEYYLYDHLETKLLFEIAELIPNGLEIRSAVIYETGDMNIYLVKSGDPENAPAVALIRIREEVKNETIRKSLHFE